MKIDITQLERTHLIILQRKKASKEEPQNSSMSFNDHQCEDSDQLDRFEWEMKPLQQGHSSNNPYPVPRPTPGELREATYSVQAGRDSFD